MKPAGLRAVPEGTLVDRALALLKAGPADGRTVARDVLGLSGVSRALGERLAAALLGADPRVQRAADGRWVLLADEMASPRLDECAFAVVDVETTGSSPGRGDRIIEIAVVVVTGGRGETVLDRLVNPERPVPPRVAALTGIAPASLRGQPPFSAVAPDLVAALAGRVFTAHNLRFDWRFVSAEVRRARDVVLDGPRVCTMALARRLLPALRSRSLDALADYFGIAIRRRHRAGGDALAAARILGRLLDLARERGAERLVDLESPSRPSRRRRRSVLPTSLPAL